jgi:molybdate transport system permease protein
MSRRWFAAGLVAALSVTLLFLVLPVVAIFVDTGPVDLLSSLGDEGALEALRLSLLCSTAAVALIVVVGTPAAYFLATRRFRGRATMVTLVELPLVLPPAVAGIGLLAAFGRTGLLSTSVPFTELAVVLAIAFVSAPFFVRTAIASFEALDPTLIAAARTLGATPWRVFTRVALPLAAGGLGAGLALSFARGLGEFGATIMFAGSLQGLTQTLSLGIYAEFARNFDVALAMSALLVAFSFILLLVVKWLSFGWTSPFRSVPSSSA